MNGTIISRLRGPWGVPVEIDQSILFLAGLLIYLGLGGGILDAVILCVVLIGSIYLHELGPAWGCRVQGIPVRRVVLHGGGGFCERAATATPREEELIVAMGPLVNLALWALAGLLIWALQVFLVANPGVGFGSMWLVMEVFGVLSLVATINFALFVFNLIPVQPLDGGKLFQLFLMRIMGRRSAHRVAGAVGLVAAVLWIPAAIWVFVTYGFILFFFPSIKGHYRMMKGDLVF